jgi:hypothetical protein
MATHATIRDVQRVDVEDLTSHLATLESELSGGRAIELMRGERVIAELRAPTLIRPDGGVEALGARRTGKIEDFIGILKGKSKRTTPATLEEIDEAIRAGWAGQVSLDDEA